MELNAKNLKETLWTNLKGVQDGSVQTTQADSMASQAREILKTIKTELEICRQSGKAVSEKLQKFPE
jgi:hypothetical protein